MDWLSGTTYHALRGVMLFCLGFPVFEQSEQRERSIKSTTEEMLPAFGIHAKTLADVAAQTGTLEQLYFLAKYGELDVDAAIEERREMDVGHGHPYFLRVSTRDFDVTFDTCSHRIRYLYNEHNCDSSPGRPEVNNSEAAAELARNFARDMDITSDLGGNADRWQSSDEFGRKQWARYYWPTVDGCIGPGGRVGITVNAKLGTVESFSNWESDYIPARPAVLMDEDSAYRLARKAFFPFWMRAFIPDATEKPRLAITEVALTMDISSVYFPPYVSGIRYVRIVPIDKDEPGHMRSIVTLDAETGRVYALM